MTVNLKTPVGRADLAWMVACGLEDWRDAGIGQICGFEPVPESEPPPAAHGPVVVDYLETARPPEPEAPKDGMATSGT